MRLAGAPFLPLYRVTLQLQWAFGADRSTVIMIAPFSLFFSGIAPPALPASV